MAQLTPQDDFIKTALRLPRDVHEKIQEAAKETGRSMNSEIVARLQQTLQPPADQPSARDNSAVLVEVIEKLLLVLEKSEIVARPKGLIDASADDLDDAS